MVVKHARRVDPIADLERALAAAAKDEHVRVLRRFWDAHEVELGSEGAIAQRAAVYAALAKLVPLGDAALPGLARLVFAVCSTALWSIDRIDQQAVGRLLCQLATDDPARVEAFFRRHARLMSPACARRAVSTLPADRRRELLACHRRATAIR